MSPQLPDGERAPRDGALPDAAIAALGTRPFGFYAHVPFCASRLATATSAPTSA